jgi:hypothetical protein
MAIWLFLNLCLLNAIWRAHTSFTYILAPNTSPSLKHNKVGLSCPVTHLFWHPLQVSRLQGGRPFCPLPSTAQFSQPIISVLLSKSDMVQHTPPLCHLKFQCGCFRHLPPVLLECSTECFLFTTTPFSTPTPLRGENDITNIEFKGD